MINVENVEVSGWKAAVRGMRNPLNSWHKSDSYFENEWIPADAFKPTAYALEWVLVDISSLGRRYVARYLDKKLEWEFFGIGPNLSPTSKQVSYWKPLEPRAFIGASDEKLMKNLAKLGPSHRKYMRMLTVSCDVTAPMYLWSEFDTYKVGTVANSCSKMHKLMHKEFELSDFSCDEMDNVVKNFLKTTCKVLNINRQMYLETKDKGYWYSVLQLLPNSYNQKRTVYLNYEVLANMYEQRKGHKLKEWNSFCDWIETLPMSYLITGAENSED